MSPGRSTYILPNRTCGHSLSEARKASSSSAHAAQAPQSLFPMTSRATGAPTKNRQFVPSTVSSRLITFYASHTWRLTNSASHTWRLISCASHTWRLLADELLPLVPVGATESAALEGLDGA